MRVFWWQGGIHIEPENDSDRDFLIKAYDMLPLLKLGWDFEGIDSEG